MSLSDVAAGYKPSSTEIDIGGEFGAMSTVGNDPYAPSRR